MTTPPIMEAAGTQPGFARGALFSLIALIALSLAWELWLAPLCPGGSALALKAIPLLFALRGTFRHNVYTLQWASMLVLLYLAEGIVRGMNDGGLSARLGWLEALLALAFFGCALAFIAPFKRAARAAKRAKAAAAAITSAPDLTPDGNHL
ncbi:MAG: Putative transmembrane protein [uncultured Caballeronia sp.]|nr:MAG: Putative transmembrane protein [uncultured Caballeronia sp.]